MTEPYRRRRRVARNTELTGSAVAGAAGVGFGAAKLRDAYKEDYPERFGRGLGHLHQTALHAGAKPATAARLVRVAGSGKPGFKPLAIGTAAAAVATGAKRYGQVNEVRHRRELRRQESVAKSDWGVELGKLPRAVIHDRQRKRVVGMHDKDHFKVLDRDDSVRIVHRSKVRIVKGTAMATNSGADPSAPPVISGKTKRMYVRRRSLGMTPDAAMASAVANSTGVTKSAFGVEHEVSKKRLTAAERNALPDSAFADPKDRRFPMEDKAHAKNALARADQGFAGAKLKARIKRKEEKIVAKSAFGVDHAEVEKSVRERRRRIHEQNRQAAASVGRREALGAALGSPVYTAAKAPKGMRLRAVKTQAKEAFKTPLGGGGATVRGYARAKKEWQNP